MRLHHLSMQAFGPYPTRQDVDFDALAGSGLFLLEGPTGAGKSTVLDAVTYALYGSAGADPGVKDRWHSDFADARTTPEVTVEWTVRGRRLRVTRVPEHRRPRLRGEGTTLAPSSVHLEELCDGTWTSVSTNKAETGEVVTDLLGLTRAQFTQVVLLPQGDFARFLRADDDARRGLLTTLFGAHLYDRITGELERRRAAAEQARRAAQTHIADALSAAGTAAGLDAGTRLALAALPEPDLEAELTRLEAELSAADQLAQVAVELAEGRLTSAEAARARAAQVDDLTARAAAARAELARWEREREPHDARVAELAAARRAAVVAPLLTALRTAAQRRGEVWDGVAKQDRAYLAQVVDLGEALDPDGPLTDGPLTEGCCDALAHAVADLEEQSRAADRQAAGLDELVRLEAELPGLERARAAALVAAAAAEQERRGADAALTDLPARLSELQAERDSTAALAAGRVEADALLETARSRYDAAAAAQALVPVIVERHATWEAACAALRAAQDENARLIGARIRGMAGELAATLVPGSPCQVCGSPDHPAPATTTEQPVSADDLAAAEVARDSRAAEAAAAETALGQAARRRDSLMARAGDLDAGSLAGRLAAAATAAEAAGAASSRLPHLDELLHQLRVAQESARARQSDAVHLLATRTAEAAAASGRLAAARDRLGEARGDHSGVGARQLALSDRAAALRVRAELLRAVVAAERHHEQVRLAAHAESLASGFAGSHDAAAAVRGAAAVDDLAAQVERDEQQRAACELTLADPAVAALGGEDPAGARLALREALSVHEAAQREHRAAAAAHAHALRAAERWSECVADLRRARREQRRVERETAAVVRLAGLAKGVDGHRKVALTTYALRHWFGQVVAAANVRLAVMSDGRYELERSDESESRARRAGLTLRVLDRYTGERRSTASLSGGETFFASLALALGLAEVVTAEAGGIALDTLFIDEGFGSLDEATLDQVMDVVDELRGRGRVVGIVSHVAELKDRIPERLEVRRNADGSSVLRVIA